jgi:hypothetical protein
VPVAVLSGVGTSLVPDEADGAGVDDSVAAPEGVAAEDGVDELTSPGS